MKFDRQRLFRDKDGRIVLWQWPNIPLYGWLVFKLLSLIVTQPALETGLEQLSSAFLFAWAYIEATSGVNYFRRSLGLLVFAAMTVNFFK